MYILAILSILTINVDKGLALHGYSIQLLINSSVLLEE